MTTIPKSSLPKAVASTSGVSGIRQALACPRCNSSVSRIRPDPDDHVFGSFLPEYQYQCNARMSDPDCRWQGNLAGEAAPPVIRQLRKTWLHLARYLKQRDNPWAVVSAHRIGDASFKDMAQITLDAIGDAVLVVDPDGTVIYLNKVAEDLTGWPRDKALGRSVEEVMHVVDGTTRERVTSPSLNAIRENRIVALRLGSVLIRYDDTELAIEDSAAPIHDRHGRMIGAVIIFHDARQSGSVMQEMSHLAQHDSLTGLPNRVLLVERLTQAIGLANRRGKQVALMFLDLDRFKQINDAFGHAVGDQLLRDVATDMLSCVRTTDTVCRHGGDEFVILLSEIESAAGAARVAEKLLARFEAPRVIDGYTLSITLSIGISIYPQDGSEPEGLLHKADQAMYAAKHAGRNRFQLAADSGVAVPAIHATSAVGKSRTDA